ncbi:hypothetical protein Psyr_3806 [Pseudomonas syringae pv. syringae B728a]|uniref:Uncharacterized protein n=1 Tax=Pseudomonas syringae pv. syringae (strain B728a) TaxID=205918 RepID=Q4ZPT5_PSEU2|nr:hypothetical protein Psyr_3806 [Pseudomonas syringae pv. syringae B728a]PYD15338.1 hypothetical protein DND47_12945 [Pseudomonas syringae pv. syringae]
MLLSRLLVTTEFLARTYTDQISGAKCQEAINEACKIHSYRYGYKLISERQIKEILNVNNQVTTLRATRKKFAHFCWPRSNDEEIFGANFSGGVAVGSKYKKSFVSFTLAELDELHKKAYAIIDRLSDTTQSLPELEEEDLSNKVRLPREGAYVYLSIQVKF